MMPPTGLPRRLLAVAVLTAAVLVATWLLWPEPAIGPVSYQRLELGMMQAAVEAVIGLPPGNYSGVNDFRAPMTRAQRGMPIPQHQHLALVRSWLGEAHAIQVAFDEKGTAVGCTLLDIVPAERLPSLLDRIRSWLRW